LLTSPAPWHGAILEEEGPISKRFIIIVVIMVAGCVVLVGVSYLMLELLSNVVAVPQTALTEIEDAGEKVLPVANADITAMQVSADGRFLAFIDRPDPARPAHLAIFELGGEPRQIMDRSIQGSLLAWTGSEDILLYEDMGDIWSWSASGGAVSNLTQSPEADSDPLPSPDGKTVLWTRQAGPGQDQAEFWLMDPDGSDKRYLCSHGELATWSPSGDRVLARVDLLISPATESYRYLLETATDGRGEWDAYTDTDRKPLFLWWPPGQDFYYVAPYDAGGQTGVKGVWFRVDSPSSIKKVASTSALSADESFYRFYPSRSGQLLAYVGQKGLEYIDIQNRVIYRFTRTDAKAPVAWDEAGGLLYYCGGEGIYRVSMSGSGS
jgi:hypothetical protein